MFSFRGGFGWVVGRALGTLVVAATIIGIMYFGGRYFTSALPWIMITVLYVLLVSALAWSGWNSSGRMRKRKLVLAGVLAIWGLLWLQTTTITRVPSEQNSTTN